MPGGKKIGVVNYVNVLLSILL